MTPHPAKRRKPTADCVTMHAIVRYCERVLGVDVDPQMTHDRAGAEACCAAAGMDLAEVRSRIWCREVQIAVGMGVPRVGTKEFTAVIGADGTITTICAAERRRNLVSRSSNGIAARDRRRRRGLNKERNYYDE